MSNDRYNAALVALDFAGELVHSFSAPTGMAQQLRLDEDENGTLYLQLWGVRSRESDVNEFFRDYPFDGTRVGAVREFVRLRAADLRGINI